MLTRRQITALGAALAATLPAALPTGGRAQPVALSGVITRPIPSSGELLPVIGMGTSQTFDVGKDDIAPLREVLAAFIQGGGKVIDTSPMYGAAETRVGDLLRSLSPRPPLFTATKVWTKGRDAGIAQMEESARRMAVDRLDLIAVHNLLDWQTQLATLKQWKAEGKVRYLGITTSHGRDHEALLAIMRKEPLDFVQFSYNIVDREAERALLPVAQERGIATMINRPFQRGDLFAAARNTPLPALAGELGCSSWGQFFLKFIVSHPAVTCVIPATAKPQHMVDNMGANVGALPDAKQREEMLRVYAALKR